jgi:hypothetical protein
MISNEEEKKVTATRNVIDITLNLYMSNRRESCDDFVSFVVFFSISLFVAITLIEPNRVYRSRENL